MFNRIRKFESLYGRLSHVTTSAANIFILQFSHFSSSAANSPKDPNPEPFSAVFLKNEFGMSSKRALMYSKYLHFDSPEKPLSVVAFFKNHHFNDSQISNLVKKRPLILKYNPESNFSPKIEFLRDLGFSSSEIVKILIWATDLLQRSLEDQLVPCVDFLRSFLHSDKDVLHSILKFPGIFRENLRKTLLPNVGTLRGVGVSDAQIAALLRLCPQRIAFDPEGFRSTVEELLKLGFHPAKRTFIVGLIVIRQLSSSSWKDKVEFYARWGLSEHQVLDAFRKYPYIMAASKDKISIVLDFITKTMGCDVSVFVTRPCLVLLSFEKRIVPRCALYQVLLSKGLIKRCSSWCAMLVCPQRSFHQKYVQRFVEKCPELLQLYEEIFSKPKVVETN